MALRDPPGIQRILQRDGDGSRNRVPHFGKIPEHLLLRELHDADEGVQGQFARLVKNNPIDLIERQVVCLQQASNLPRHLGIDKGQHTQPVHMDVLRRPDIPAGILTRSRRLPRFGHATPPRRDDEFVVLFPVRGTSHINDSVRRIFRGKPAYRSSVAEKHPGGTVLFVDVFGIGIRVDQEYIRRHAGLDQPLGHQQPVKIPGAGQTKIIRKHLLAQLQMRMQHARIRGHDVIRALGAENQAADLFSQRGMV